MSNGQTTPINVPHPNFVEEPLTRPSSVKNTERINSATGDKSDNSSAPPGMYAKLVSASDLTPVELQKYERAFRIFDRTGDGYITCGELERVMHSLGMNPNVDELHLMVSAADLSRSGVVEFDEFIQMMTSYNARHPNDEEDDEILLKIFQVFDRSKDGYINMYEVRNVMKSLGETVTDEELRAMLNVADTSGDGIVTFEEFRSICISGDLKKRPI